MHRTVEAIVEADGTIRLLEPFEREAGPYRVLVTFLEAGPDEGGALAPLLSEGALSDWAREEEDAAWSHLQPEP